MLTGPKSKTHLEDFRIFFNQKLLDKKCMIN